MKRFFFHRAFLLLIPVALTFTSCHFVVGRAMVAQVIRIVGQQAGRIAISEGIEYAIDALFTAIFTDASNQASNEYSDSVIPYRNKPGFGYLSYDGLFKVKSSRPGMNLVVNKIKIPGAMIEFARTQYGTWELTSKSRALIKERTEVATAQQVLRGFEYDPRGIDGVIGNRTRAAVKKMKKAHPHVFGTNPDGELDAFTRHFLLTYEI